MAITGVLVERTPHKVRYTCTSNGGATASPDSFVIPNADGVTPDLRTDAGGLLGFQGSALDLLVSTPVVTQADARELLNGIGLTAVGDLSTERGELSIAPLNSLGDQHWGIDANEGAAAGSAPSAGFAVLVITGPNVNLASAIAELRFDHTYQR
jgi:hypothetical protein